MSGPVTWTYVGQVEQDSIGALWAVLYCGEHVVSKEQVRSLRRGKRRVADLVLSASDSFVELERSSPMRLNRLVEQRPLTRSYRKAVGTARKHLAAATTDPAGRERLVTP